MAPRRLLHGHPPANLTLRHSPLSAFPVSSVPRRSLLDLPAGRPQGVLKQPAFRSRHVRSAHAPRIARPATKRRAAYADSGLLDAFALRFQAVPFGESGRAPPLRDLVIIRSVRQTRSPVTKRSTNSSACARRACRSALSSGHFTPRSALRDRRRGTDSCAPRYSRRLPARPGPTRHGTRERAWMAGAPWVPQGGATALCFLAGAMRIPSTTRGPRTPPGKTRHPLRRGMS